MERPPPTFDDDPNPAGDREEGRARPVLDYRRSNDYGVARVRPAPAAGFAIGVAVYVATCSACAAIAWWYRPGFAEAACAVFLVPPVALAVAAVVEIELEWPAVFNGATVAFLASLAGCCGLVFLRC